MDKGHDHDAMRQQFRGTGLYWTLILTLLVAVAIIIGIIQNSQGITLKYLAWTGRVSLAVALLATTVLTVALTSLVGMAWRRHRRRQLTDTVELRDLRGHAKAPPPKVPSEALPPAVAVSADRPGDLPAASPSATTSSGASGYPR